eukprot:gene50822-20831_t
MDSDDDDDGMGRGQQNCARLRRNARSAWDRAGGVVTGLMLIIFFMFVTLLSVFCLVVASDLSGITSYAGLAKGLWGRKGGVVVHVCIFSLTFSAACAYLLVMSDMLKAVFTEWGAGSGLSNKYVIIIILTV